MILASVILLNNSMGVHFLYTEQVDCHSRLISRSTLVITTSVTASFPFVEMIRRSRSTQR